MDNPFSPSLSQPYSNFNNLTIVVPTLGKHLSSHWIANILELASMSVHIYIILPPNYDPSETDLLFNISCSNISIYVSSFRGQVAQRLYGFSLVRTEFVLQLDDDVIIESTTLSSLLRYLSLSESPLAISPLIKNPRLSFSSQSKGNPLYQVRNALLYCSFSPISGKISKSGFPVPITPNQFSSLQSVSWLPGCCVLYRTKNIYHSNYFPFSGKAYCEDLIHSFNLLKNGVSLVVATDLYIQTPIASFIDFTLRQFAEYIKNDYRVRSHFVRLTSNNIYLMHISYFFIILSFVLRAIFIGCSSVFQKLL